MLVITIENPVATGVGFLGNIISICAILAPVPTFYRIYKKKSTESFHSVPYVVGLFSAMLWLYYALLTMDVLLLTINVLSCSLQTCYIFIYLLYAPSKQKGFTFKLISLLNLGLFGSIALLTYIFLKGEKRCHVVGFLSATLSVSVFAAPLSIIKLVIKTKSVEYMPFLLSFFLTLAAIFWFCYGLLIKDYFVALPNVVGFAFGIVQIIIYFMYMNRKKVGSEAKTQEEAEDNLPKVTDSEIELNDGNKSSYRSTIQDCKCQCAMPEAENAEILA